MLFAGIDSGNKYMKGVTRNKQVIFQNVVCAGQNRFDMMGGMTKGKDIVDQLDVEIENPNGNKRRYWLGSLAYKEGNGDYIKDKDKINSEYGRASFLTSLALLAENKYEQFVIATGLPVSDIKTDLKQKYDDSIPGKYKVKFCSGPLEDEEVFIEVIASRVYPQGVGIFFDQTLDENCRYNNWVSENSIFGIIDIGSRTTNLLRFEDLQPMKNTTIEHGINDVHEKLYNIVTQAGYPVPPGRDEELIEKDYLKGGIDLKTPRQNALKDLANHVVNEAKYLYSDVEAFLDKIFIAGGAGQKIYDFLDLKDKELVPRPQFANAYGFMKAVTAGTYEGKVVDTNGEQITIQNAVKVREEGLS